MLSSSPSIEILENLSLRYFYIRKANTIIFFLFTQLEVCVYHVEQVSGCLLRTCWNLVDTDWTYTSWQISIYSSWCLLFSESTKDSKHGIYLTSVYFKWKWWKTFLCYLYHLLSSTFYLNRISKALFISEETFTVVSNGLRKKKNSHRP